MAYTPVRFQCQVPGLSCGPLLMPVQRFDDGVDVENPGLFQQRLVAPLQMVAQPSAAGLFAGLLKRPTPLDKRPPEATASNVLHAKSCLLVKG